MRLRAAVASIAVRSTAPLSVSSKLLSRHRIVCSPESPRSPANGAAFLARSTGADARSGRSRRRPAEGRAEAFCSLFWSGPGRDWVGRAVAARNAAGNPGSPARAGPPGRQKDHRDSDQGRLLGASGNKNQRYNALRAMHYFVCVAVTSTPRA